MATRQKEIIIEATPEQTWAAVCDVGAVHTRLTPGYVVATHIDGDNRWLTFPNGVKLREKIITIDEDARRLAYAVVEGGSNPLIFHHATFQVFAEGTNHSRLVWITDFLPHERAEEIHLRMARGIMVMKETIEAEQSHG